MDDLMLKELLREVKKMLKQWYEGKILWRNYPIYTVNTKEGNLAYHKQTGKPSIIRVGISWDSEYGSLESHGGKHFIFLNNIIVDNYCEGDILSTIIHEILHIIYSNDSEKDIEEMTKAICEHFNIRPEKTLENL